MEKTRPKLKIPLTLPEIVIEGICVLSLLGAALFMLLNYNDLPNRIPSHFGFSGQVDGWGGKGGLIVLLIANMGLYVSLTVLGIFPHTFNYLCEITDDNAEFQYTNARTLIRLVKTEISLMLSYLLCITILVAKGKAEGVGIAFLPIVLIVLFGTLAFFIIRMIRNK
jgi:uncharacterized membrane protein